MFGLACNLFSLDFDFLLRDQRMLESLRNLPRKTRLALRNSLTKRFPAVPLPLEARCQVEKMDWFEKQKIPLVDETKEDITLIGINDLTFKKLKLFYMSYDGNVSLYFVHAHIRRTTDRNDQTDENVAAGLGRPTEREEDTAQVLGVPRAGEG